MDLTRILPLLTDRRADTLAAATRVLEAAIETGLVRNKVFTDCKDVINRAVEEAVEYYNRSTKDYNYDTLIMGAHNLKSGLKEATKKGTDGRMRLYDALMPLRDLLEAAKPLIVKKGDAGYPKPAPTAAQLADDAKRMTCQCCGRRIFAETGVIAHHGYERPEQGWQTASCHGARHLPWEVSRTRLGQLIGLLQNRLFDAKRAREDVATENADVTHVHHYYDHKLGRSTTTLHFNRDDFAAVAENHPKVFTKDHPGFEAYLAKDIENRTRVIRQLADTIKEMQARWDSWKPTHRRERDGKTFTLICE